MWYIAKVRFIFQLQVCMNNVKTMISCLEDNYAMILGIYIKLHAFMFMYIYDMII